MFRDRVRGYRLSVPDVFRHNLRLPLDVIGIINRMFRPGQQPVFCSCAGAKRFVEQTPKKGLSELSANRGCALTSRASARNPFAEPDSFPLRNSLRTRG